MEQPFGCFLFLITGVSGRLIRSMKTVINACKLQQDETCEVRRDEVVHWWTDLQSWWEGLGVIPHVTTGGAEKKNQLCHAFSLMGVATTSGRGLNADPSC